MSRDYFNQLAADWDQRVDHDRAKIREMINILPDFSSPWVLDVGTGTGILIPFLLEKYPQASITGIDFAEKMIERAASKYGNREQVQFKSANIYDCYYSNEFNLITAYSVFPHLRKKEAILRRFYKYLKPGGVLVIFHSESRREINGFHSHAGGEVAADRLPSASELTSIAKKPGFKSLQVIEGEDRYFVMVKK